METLEALDTEQQCIQFQTLVGHDSNIVALNPKALLATLDHTKGPSIMVRVEHLHVMENFNPRVRTPALIAHIRRIADSIKEEGFLEDEALTGIATYEGKTPCIKVTDGHCRLAALKLAIAEGADIKLVPVVLKDRSTTSDDLHFAMVRCNNGGMRFTPLELAIILKRLHRNNWSEKALAERMGFSEEYVVQLLTIADAPDTIREMIAQGEVPLAVALQSIRTYGAQAQTVLQEVVTNAKAKGQSKITRKDLPQQVYKKTLNKATSDMVKIVQQVHTHQAFAALPEDLQELISKVVTQLAQAAAGHEKATAV